MILGTHVKYGGSGLGLYISKSLSGLQGGAIGVNSEPYVGSTFAFFVGSRVAPVPANVSSRNEERFAHTRLVDEELRAARLNILIVEDNLVNQKVLRKELEKAGCRCDVAGNGVEALDWLRKSVYWQGEAENDESAKGTHADTPDAFIEASVAPKHELDLILMDIEMPVMDGLACSRAIRDYENRGLLVAPKLQAQLPPSIIGPLSSPPSPTTPFAESNPLPSFPDFIPSSLQPATPNPGPKLRIPILAVSANARSEQVKHALAAGMDDAIAKPFRIRELRPKMETLVDRLRG
jgi:CheY-like chemotaxis protein